ncbi:MAG: VOC family protein [Candidatus Bathyarchaeia archaeon]|jgi:catechol 2,3-dioxygenase-like lactoylglutathione lyase family enzyme
MRQKITLITLGTADLEQATSFYEKGLGWKRSSASTENLVLYDLGGVGLALYPRKLLAEDATVPEAGSGFSGITLSYNAENEAEVDQVLAEVSRLGATVVKQAQKVFWGGYSGYFKDPDGHLIEVAYNPFWQLDSEGSIKIPA